MPCHRLKLIEKAVTPGLTGVRITKAGSGAARIILDYGLINGRPARGKPSKQLLR